VHVLVAASVDVDVTDATAVRKALHEAFTDAAFTRRTR
jgi:hypothetical protein